MSISSNDSRHVVNNISTAAQSVVNWSTTTINSGFERITGQVLYEKMFGAIPYKAVVTLSEEMKLIMSRPGEPVLLKATGVRFETEVSFVVVPVLLDQEYKSEAWMSMRLAKPMPYLMKYTERTGYYFSEDKDKSLNGVREWDVRKVADSSNGALTYQVQGVLRDNYPTEFVDGVMRVASVSIRLLTLQDRVSHYMTKVNSMGALYLNLPSLNVISPKADIKHVRYMRGGDKPSHQLVEDLNLLATMKAARKAAGILS